MTQTDKEKLEEIKKMIDKLELDFDDISRQYEDRDHMEVYYNIQEIKGILED